MGEKVVGTALVTGGAGFIGSHLVERLLADGVAVVVVDDLSTGSTANLAAVADHPGLRFVHGSCADRRVVEPEVAASDTVFHLASTVGVRLVMERPVETIGGIVDTARTVLTACAEQGRRVVLTSTSEVYGASTTVPYGEDDPPVGSSPGRTRGAYAAAKLLVEFLALAHHREQGLPATVLRLFNTVGPRQSGRYGMVLPTFVRAALSGAPLLVHGDGSQRRCFGAVTDVVDGIVRAAVAEGAVGAVVNLGSQEEVTIDELAHRVIARTGSGSAVHHVPHDAVYGPAYHDHHRRVPDLRRAEALLGWRPTTPLDAVVAAVVDHERQWWDRSGSTPVPEDRQDSRARR